MKSRSNLCLQTSPCIGGLLPDHQSVRDLGSSKMFRQQIALIAIGCLTYTLVWSVSFWPGAHDPIKTQRLGGFEGVQFPSFCVQCSTVESFISGVLDWQFVFVDEWIVTEIFHLIFCSRCDLHLSPSFYVRFFVSVVLSVISGQV